MRSFVLAFLVAVVAAVGTLTPAAAQQSKFFPGLSADPLNTLVCGFQVIPAKCTPLDRVVGGAIDGAAIGFGAGAIVGAAGGVIAGGGAFAGAGTTAVALSGMGLGAIAGAGAGATTSVLLNR